MRTGQLSVPTDEANPRRSCATCINMTPMVDVTFLLLVFFMVTAAFTLQRSFELPVRNERPSDTRIEPDEEVAFVTVTIDEFNSYRVSTPDWEKEAPSEQDLRIALRSVRRQNASESRPTAMLVRASGEAFHEKVVAALDAGMAVGMDELQLWSCPIKSRRRQPRRRALFGRTPRLTRKPGNRRHRHADFRKSFTR